MNEIRTPSGGRYLPFISDYGFKVTFGNEKNTLFLKKALQVLVENPYPILEIQFDKTISEAMTKDGRGAIFDMVCTDERGHTFIVEMQIEVQPYFFNRLMFYTFHRFDKLVKKGKFDFKIDKKIYCIAFLGSNLNEIDAYHNIVNLRNKDAVLINDQITYVTVELEKFILKPQEVSTDLEKLIFTIKHGIEMKESANKPPFLEEDWLKSALDELDIRAMTPDEYEAYMHYLVAQADKQREIDEAEEKGKNEGKIEGKIEGKRLFIKNLLLNTDFSLEKIASLADASMELVVAIKKELDVKS